MTALRRILPLAFGVLLLVLATRNRWGHTDVLFDPGAIAVTVLLPWIALVVTASMKATATTFADMFSTAAQDLPAAQRAASTTRVEFLAGASVAAGLIAGMLSLVAGFNEIAAQGGQAPAGAWPGLTAGLLLGPVYGLALKTLLYDPAATALAAAGTELDGVLES